MRINASLKTEVVNGEVLVLDSQSSVVHRLTGDAATYVTRLINEPGTELPDNEITAGLITSGIIEETSMSRRRLVATAASLAAMGIVTLALPSAAAAASIGGGGGGGGSDTTTTSTTTVPGEVVQEPTIVADFTNDQSIVRITWRRPSGSLPNRTVTYSYELSGPGTPSTISGSTLSSSYVSPDLTDYWDLGETVTVKVIGQTPALYAGVTRTVVLTKTS